MQDLRLVLIILGVIAIVALIAHGLWSNKKNQVKPLKDKPLGKLAPHMKDKEGFDFDGIGKKRVVNKSVAPIINTTNTKKPVPVVADKIEPQFSYSKPEVETKQKQDKVVLADSFSAIDAEAPIQATHPLAEDTVIDDVSYDVSYDVVEAAPIVVEATSSVIESEPALDNEIINTDQEQTVNNTNQQQAVKNDAVITDTKHDDTDYISDIDNSDIADEAVFVINIMAREGKLIAGAELLQELSAFGFKFGAMNIFHRHVDAAGKGPVIFSLANMVKPGIFDIDTMKQFETPGVSLFMMFPCAGQASHNHRLMLRAAEHIAESVDGLLMDGSRNPLTQDAIKREQAFIRQLENKVLVTKSH